MSKINFTKDHFAKLKDLAVKFLFKGIVIKGAINTELSVWDIIHNTTLNTLSTIYGNLKREVEKISNLDEWNLTDYQQRKLESLKEQLDFVNLTIGYKKYQVEIQADKEKLKELKAKQLELKESTLSPTERLAALEAEIAAIEDIEEL